MGTCVDGNDMTLHVKRQQQHQADQPQSGFSTSGSHWNAEDALIDRLKNVGLESDSTNDKRAVADDQGAYGGPDNTGVLPLRPYAGDCSHYIRTGTCKFGLGCRFNHPVKRSNQVVREKDWSSENAAQIECKYYLTAGGCKYGSSCKYSHPNIEFEAAGPELNFLGLPIRLGAKECPYYMRNGSCGYGARCMFHHPEPTSMGGLDTLNPTFTDRSMIQSGYSLGSASSESSVLFFQGASQSDHAPWSSHPLSHNNLAYQNDCASYMNANSFAQGMQSHSKRDGNKGADMPHETTLVHLAPETKNRADMLESNVSVEGEGFPERPGLPICTYFLKTGDCKFKSACRFHHPKDWTPKSDVCTLSAKGLPLRPGRDVCRHYDRFGICKFGRACLFDHPVDHKFSPFPIRPTPKPVSGNDTRSWVN